MWIASLVLASVLSLSEPVVVDSDQTLAQAVAGTSAPDSVVRTLEIVAVEYYAFDGKLHRGQMVVHRAVADDVKRIFGEIKRRKFPVQSVIPIKFDRPNNGTSMDTLNNSYGFHYRPIVTAKTTKLSVHSTGRAIDINPFQNPAVLKNGTILPRGAAYVPQVAGTLTDQTWLTQLFEKLGWEWGGEWVSLKDYMHFEKR